MPCGERFAAFARSDCTCQELFLSGGARLVLSGSYMGRDLGGTDARLTETRLCSSSFSSLLLMMLSLADMLA